ncbi:TPA: hypothetical protein DEO28_00075 [Candidatus Dependentiae bacterium]|nr:MAG: 16S ribosomal RNA methyltransferase RsmE [candidate division TM6 bacterium GW2011_GWE2_31_21]KKP53993.1 MAG: 16S ribosomal RNA methyltransferase RsmE [candidate division TM6 bacterium GW2011_GWF2_33_332]HBS48426.1 hypothetical protein [Candidatus Dependentiae bacterium]HBZ72900.1 hypothetical protein [Candidatus Dependentiae bacterium]
MSNKHIFALFFKDLSSKINSSKKIVLQNKELLQRITKILRLRTDENFILFDNKSNGLFSLSAETFASKDTTYAEIISINENKKLKTNIVLALPILKKEDFETSVCNVSAIGANIIQPIISQKVQRKWYGDKELERLQKISVAACEQSKNFAIPQILNPTSFENFVAKIKTEYTNHKKIIFEDSTNPLLDLLSDLNSKKHSNILVTVGPEGGYNEEELKTFRDLNFDFITLTPTILKAVEAVTIGIGAIKSVVE